jgi:hypothetical protein
MISEIIRGLSKGDIKPNKENAILFGVHEYPKTIKQAIKQFKLMLWQKK